MDPLYRFENITCRYGRHTALDIAALEIPGTEMLCVRGANGAGKSTLLQLLALLQPTSSGCLWFDGHRVLNNGRARRALRRQVCLVHQQPLMLRGSVADNVSYGLKLQRMSRLEQQHRKTWALQSVDLEGFAERPAQELSGGETRRVALARALALKPRVLLLDEPFAGLDHDQAQSFESLLGGMQRRGQTIILTTHDAELESRLKAPSVHLVNGRIGTCKNYTETHLCQPRLKMHVV